MNLLKMMRQQHEREGEGEVVEGEEEEWAPMFLSYKERIKPLLETVDQLRQLKIMEEGIQLPTIVVVGDQSSGKSSVLESLAGIRLPRGQGICTRVPLIMTLKSHTDPQPHLSLHFNGKTVPTDEANLVDDIIHSTHEIAGKGKGISDTPLTLVVKKKGVPDLTMVDLPGITRVAVRGQPDDIYEQISNIITKYITSDESIILNVLQAGIDFSTCESIRMSQRVDKTGKRTLAVVTKADVSPEGLLEKVVGDDVNIGLGYVCVRNRIGDETYEEARAKEAKLFETNPHLSKIDKSIVGIPVLADRLTRIQATIIVKCLPEIVRKINDKLTANGEELSKMPKHLTSVADAMTAFINILASARESLRKIMLQGEFDEYPDNCYMHSTARLAEMLDKYAKELELELQCHDHKDHILVDDVELELWCHDHKDHVLVDELQVDEDAQIPLATNENFLVDELQVDEDARIPLATNENFLVDEMKILEECRSVGLPDFIPKSAFRTLLAKKVKVISDTPFYYVEKIWNYIQSVVLAVLLQHCGNYPQLISCTKRAAKNLISTKKQQSVDWMSDLIEMEKLSDYTCNPEYTSTWADLMSGQDEFMKRVQGEFPLATIRRFGEINIVHLWNHNHDTVRGAYDLKMRMAAYWDIVRRRMVDNTVLHLLFSIQNLVNKEMQREIINELMGPQGNGLERMLEELPSVSAKRKKLQNSIDLLKQSKDIVAIIIDKIDADVD